MRKNVYNKFKRGVKNHMDKSIKKDFNDYDIQNDNNIENDNDDEINTNSNKKNKNIIVNNMFQRKQLLDIDDNQNGMSINTILNKTIKEKKKQIEEMENELEVKYNELQNEYEELYEEYSNLVNKVNEKL